MENTKFFDKLIIEDFLQENPTYQFSEFIMHPIVVIDFI